MIQYKYGKYKGGSKLINDMARLMNDVRTIVSTISPDTDEIKLTFRLEEIINNYDVHRKSNEDLENDLQEKIEMYINARRIEGYSKATLEGYRIELGMFGKFIDKSIVLVNTSDIRKYLASNEKWQPSTVDRKLSVIKAFFSWLVDEELLIKNPASKIKPPKQPKRLPKGLSVKEIEMVREACITNRERALMEVMYSTACRLSEIASMKRSDVDQQNMSINVIGKGNKERTVYLSDKAMYHLSKYLLSRKEPKDGPSEYLFIGEKRPYRDLTGSAIERIVDKIEQRANITKKLTPHVFRHTAATLMTENGADLADVQHILGHENPSTTLIYSHVSEARKKQAHKRYHVQ